MLCVLCIKNYIMTLPTKKYFIELSLINLRKLRITELTLKQIVPLARRKRLLLQCENRNM